MNDLIATTVAENCCNFTALVAGDQTDVAAGIGRQAAAGLERFDVVGHLIHGERTDWIPRARHILAGDSRPFEAFDREAQFSESRDKSIGELLATFTRLRRENLETLRGFSLTSEDLGRRGLHPELGEVTLGQLLSTWVVHDLDHVGQVARTMAKVNATTVGPWAAYLSILRDRIVI